MKKLLTIALALLITVPAFSEINWQRFDFFSNAGGLNDSVSAINIKDNEATSLQNVVFTKGASIKTRDGFVSVNTVVLTGTVITGVEFYKQADGTKFLVSVVDDDSIRKMDYAVGGAPDGTWDDITGALSFTNDQDDLASFAVGEDILVIEDGLNSTAPYKWTGTGNAAALGGSPANAKMVEYHKRHMFLAGNDSNPSLLYFSDLGDIENFTTGLSGNVAVETNDGSVIRSIKSGFDALYIWKDRSIWRLSGDDKDNFELQRMVEGIGCLSVHCATLIGNDFFFTDGQGDTYIYDGAVKLRLISSKVEGSFDALNFSRFDNIVVTDFNKDYFVSGTTVGGSDNNRIFMFDTFHLAWTKFVGMEVNAFTVGDDGNGVDTIYFGDYDGDLQQYPSGTNDDGTAIDAQYITKQMSFPSMNPDKTFNKMLIYATQKGDYDLNVELRTDFSSTGTNKTLSLQGANSLWGSSVYGVDSYGGQNLVSDFLDYSTEGRFFQLKYFNSTLDQPFEIKGWQPFIEASDSI